MRIALAQINTIVGDFNGNRNKILHYVHEAIKNKAEIITFPEFAVCGYPPEDLLLKKSFIKDSIKNLNYITSKIPKDIIVMTGCVSKNSDGYIHNSAAIINNQRIHAIYHKVELPNYGVFDEKRYFKKGLNNPMFMLDDICFGVNICEDIWLDSVAEDQVYKGARVLFNISASPYNMGKLKERKEKLSKKAWRLSNYICYNNLVGGQDELVFDGGSFVIDSKGKEIACAKVFEEDLLVCEIDIIPGSKRYFVNYVDLKLKKPGADPLVKNQKTPTLKPIEEIYNALIIGTRDYVNKNGFKKAVIGLSGGIDSALTAAIACRAIGSKNVVGVTMPSRYSSDETKKDAKLLAKNLKIKLINIPIDKLLNTYLNELDSEFKGQDQDITEENIQARIRGNILMALSNKFGWLVLSTGNKSEISCGYCTLYGDMVGGFNILKDVYKTVVYKLALFINKHDSKIIPNTIIKRPPTAELKPNQKDQDTLPPYETLDEILRAYIEEDKSYEDIVGQNRFKASIVKKIIGLVDRNEYKRRQSPPGIKITTKNFGKDRRLPITNFL